jgi:1-acyl-sn-glycerol-3-phosphate acyltransferase
MRKPFYKPNAQAFPDITLPAPFLSKTALLFLTLFARIYLRIFSGLTSITLRQADRLIESFNRTLSGKTSTILAFRHPYGDEPQLLSCLAICLLTKIAKRSGVRFPIKSHIAFVHGYEVPRWSGSFVRWLLPRILSMPIYHAKMDSTGMARIYRAIEQGPYPVGIAPEGQVSYNSELVQRLEQGVIRMGFQCAVNLDRDEHAKNVEILPVSIHYRYGKKAQAQLEKMMRKIERITHSIQAKNLSIFQRFEVTRDHLLKINEAFYKIPVNPDHTFLERKERVMAEALHRAETILGINKPDEDTIIRVYHIRQIYWDRIYLPGKLKNDLSKMPLVEKALADRLAGEAWYASRHMELVDILFYFEETIPSEDAPFHLRVEYAQNLWDFASRTMGGNFTHRLNVYPKKAIIYTGEAIDLTKKLPEYRERRKETITATLQELRDNFLQCIEEVRKDDIP